MTADSSLPSVRCLTPAGSAAVAVLEARGPGIWTVVQRHFRPAGRLPRWTESTRPGTIYLGRLGPDPGDEVVLIVRQSGGDPAAELHCHGGVQVVRWLLHVLREAGCAAREQWAGTTAGAALHHRATAARLLPSAPSLRTANLLLAQASGAMERELRDARAELVAGNRSEAARIIERALRAKRVGDHLIAPWRVTVAGAPNVGKSSLVNVLAGYARCVVSPVAGTTRDLVGAQLVLDGWPVEMLDTAGLRAAEDDLESQGIQRTEHAARTADLCVWVLAADTSPQWPPPAMNPLVVVNKCDLPQEWAEPHDFAAVHVSALNGDGVDELARAVADRLVPDPPLPTAAVPLTEVLAQALEECLRDLAACRDERVRAVIERLIGAAAEPFRPAAAAGQD